MNKREMICIACPQGCRLTVTEDGDISVTGNSCPKGINYGKSEYQNPVRAVSTLVRVKGGERPIVSVRTDKPVPKIDIALVLEIAKHIEVSAPVRIGDIVAENITPSANLIATIDCNLQHKE